MDIIISERKVTLSIRTIGFFWSSQGQKITSFQSNGKFAYSKKIVKSLSSHNMLWIFIADVDGNGNGKMEMLIASLDGYFY